MDPDIWTSEVWISETTVLLVLLFRLMTKRLTQCNLIRPFCVQMLYVDN